VGVDDWAGRGGMGSLMAQAHRNVAIAYGAHTMVKHLLRTSKALK
jgi:aldehyde:ferredoxin oxidoreductase